MASNRPRARIIFCILFAATACSTTPRPPDYRIALVASKGQHGIFVMNADRTGSKLLVPDARAQLRPASWSPDGKFIAFLSYHPAGNETGHKFQLYSHYALYVTDARGNSQRQLVNFPVSSFGWSPDSRKMFLVSAFEDPEADAQEVLSGKRQPSSAIYLLDLDTGSQTRITSLGQNCAATWSPDGTSLAFSSGNSRQTQVYVATLSGGKARQLTTSAGLNLRPSWSSDGKTIAYLAIPTAAAPQDDSGVFIIDSDGSNNRKISDLSSYEVSWSPDGERLLIQCPDGLFLWNVNGEKPVRLDLETDRPLEAVFTPDGGSLMYRSNHEGAWHLYAVDLGTGKSRRLTGQLSVASFCLSPLLSAN